MDKLNKYLKKITDGCNGKIIYSQRSTYYHIQGRIIRVSDHIGKNSDGSISIIYDAARSDNFIIHAHSSGYVSIANYKTVKNIIKTFTILPALIDICTSAPQANLQNINKLTILGHDTHEFTTGQLQTINNMIKKNIKIGKIKK